MKSICVYESSREVQVAKGVNGAYYHREWTADCYGPRWTKWKHLGKVVSAKRSTTKWVDLDGYDRSKTTILARFSENPGLDVVIPVKKYLDTKCRLPNA